eukprot:6334691-Pyramimonas_sp.AAC.1
MPWELARLQVHGEPSLLAIASARAPAPPLPPPPRGVDLGCFGRPIFCFTVGRSFFLLRSREALLLSFLI